MQEKFEAPNPEAAAEVLGTSVPAVASPTAVAMPQSAVGQRIADPESNGSVKLPQLKITYGVGKLAVKFSQGDLILDETYRLVGKDEPLIITFASEVVYWKEYLTKAQKDADPNRKSKVYASKQAAKDAGEIVDWPPRGMDGPKPTASKAGVFQMLIQKPEKLECALFCYPLGGTLWAPARGFLDKKAFQIVDAEILRALQFMGPTRKGGLAALKFEIRTKVALAPNGQRTECVPVARHVGGHPEADALEIIKAFSGAGPTTDDADVGEEG